MRRITDIMHIWISGVLLPLVLFTMCSRMEEEETGSGEWAGTEKTVPVMVFLDADRMSSVTPSTKHPGSTIESEPDQPIKIHNVWIAQFSGTSDDAKMSRSPLFIEKYGWGEGEDNTASLVADTGESTIVFLANTFDGNLMLGEKGKTTLGDFKKKYITLSTKNDLADYEEKSLFGSDDGTLYQRLNGSVTASIRSGTTDNDLHTKDAPLRLKRSMARLDITINNKSGGKLLIDSYQLCSVQDRDYIFTNRDDLQDSFPETVSNTLPYPKETWPSGEDATTVSYYVPANIRGSGKETGMPQNKGYEAPRGATYLRIDATPTDDPQAEVRFYFYLGESLDDAKFNIRPNHKYKYTFDISGMGDATSDSRVEYRPSVVNLQEQNSERPNSYFLHVPASPDKTTRFIIPVEKADLFWSDPQYGNSLFVCERTTSDQAYGKDMVLGDNGTWTPEILWSDIDEIVSKEKVKIAGYTGQGKDGTIDLDVKGGITGNVVIGIYREVLNSDKRKVYLWTWHLWLTDYDPDIQPESLPGSLRTVSVRSGRVVRLRDDGDIVMDRPLGCIFDPADEDFRTKPTDSDFRSMDQDYRATLPGMGLLYQYGRKDPFPTLSSTYYYVGGNETSTTSPSDITVYRDNAADINNGMSSTGVDSKMTGTITDIMDRGGGTYYFHSEGNRNIAFSIIHPMNLILRTGTWNSGDESVDDQFNPRIFSQGNNIIWMDPYAATRDGAYEKIPKGKSMFDPCPTGWKVPAESFWDDVSLNELASYTLHMGYISDYGSRIWNTVPPSALTESDLYNSVLFPFIGYRSDSGVFRKAETSAVWTSTPTSNSRAATYVTRDRQRYTTISNQATSQFVRCVKINPSN